jgi:hypothetical protein
MHDDEPEVRISLRTIYDTLLDQGRKLDRVVDQAPVVASKLDEHDMVLSRHDRRIASLERIQKTVKTVFRWVFSTLGIAAAGVVIYLITKALMVTIP